MFMISARIVDEHGKLIGYRLINIDKPKNPDTTDREYAEGTIDKVAAVLKANPGLIANAIEKQGDVIGTNGSLDRYVAIHKGKIIVPKGKKAPLIIMNKLVDETGNLLGYNLVDGVGHIAKVSVDDAVKYAELFGICNGKVVSKDGLTFISSISGTYPERIVERSKKHSDVKVVKANLDRDSVVAQSALEDVVFNLDMTDELGFLSDTQRAVIADYYVWYTTSIYESLVTNGTLGCSIAKLEKFKNIRGDQEWQFAGVVDGGTFGSFRCEMGHKLRYAYFAKPVGSTDPKERIVFGIQCVAEFFNLDRNSMAALQKATTTMSDEMEIIHGLVKDNRVDEYNREYLSFFSSVLKKLKAEAGNDKAKFRGDLVNIFTPVFGNFIANFYETGLPIPKSLIVQVSIKEDERNTLKRFYTRLFPEYKETISIMVDEGTEKLKAIEAYEKSYRTPVNYISRYGEYGAWYQQHKDNLIGSGLLEWYAHEVLEGRFAYNPNIDKSSWKNLDNDMGEGELSLDDKLNKLALNRKDIDGYNSKTRFAHECRIKYLNIVYLSNIRVPKVLNPHRVQPDDLKDIQLYIQVMALITTLRQKASDEYLRQTGHTLEEDREIREKFNKDSRFSSNYSAVRCITYVWERIGLLDIAKLSNISLNMLDRLGSIYYKETSKRFTYLDVGKRLVELNKVQGIDKAVHDVVKVLAEQIKMVQDEKDLDLETEREEIEKYLENPDIKGMAQAALALPSKKINALIDRVHENRQILSKYRCRKATAVLGAKGIGLAGTVYKPTTLDSISVGSYANAFMALNSIGYGDALDWLLDSDSTDKSITMDDLKEQYEKYKSFKAEYNHLLANSKTELEAIQALEFKDGEDNILGRIMVYVTDKLDEMYSSDNVQMRSIKSLLISTNRVGKDGVYLKARDFNNYYNSDKVSLNEKIAFYARAYIVFRELDRLNGTLDSTIENLGELSKKQYRIKKVAEAKEKAQLHSKVDAEKASEKSPDKAKAKTTKTKKATKKADSTSEDSTSADSTSEGEQSKPKYQNNQYNLKDKPDFKEQIDKLTEFFENDGDTKDWKAGESDFIQSVLRTIKRYNKVSDKQMKYITRAYNKINKK